jgi:hypothetical protein
MAGLGQMPRPIHVFVVAHAVEELPPPVAGLGQVGLVVVGDAPLHASFLGQQDVIEPDPGALRVDVQLADAKGLVAGVAEGLGQGRQCRHGLTREHAVTVHAGRAAGHQGATGRHADRRL